VSLWWRLLVPWRLVWFVEDAWGHGWEPESLCVLAGAYLGLLGYALTDERWREMWCRAWVPC
jgi:hypothetical protein